MVCEQSGSAGLYGIVLSDQTASLPQNKPEHGEGIRTGADRQACRKRWIDTGVFARIMVSVVAEGTDPKMIMIDAP